MTYNKAEVVKSITDNEEVLITFSCDLRKHIQEILYECQFKWTGSSLDEVNADTIYVLTDGKTMEMSWTTSSILAFMATASISDVAKINLEGYNEL